MENVERKPTEKTMSAQTLSSMETPGNNNEEEINLVPEDEDLALSNETFQEIRNTQKMQTKREEDFIKNLSEVKEQLALVTSLMGAPPGGITSKDELFC